MVVNRDGEDAEESSDHQLMMTMMTKATCDSPELRHCTALLEPAIWDRDNLPNWASTWVVAQIASSHQPCTNLMAEEQRRAHPFLGAE